MSVDPGTARYTPTRSEFERLAAQHALVPVWREVLADLVTPLSVYDRLRARRPGATAPPAPTAPSSSRATFLLESVEHGERWGRYSFIGLSPFLELSARAGTVRLDGEAPPEAVEAAAGGDPLHTLEVLLATLDAPDLEGLPPLFAGAVGYIGYDLVRFVERIGETGVDDLGLDDARLVFPGQVVAFDHLRQRLSVISNVRPGDDPHGAYERAVEASEALVSTLAEPVSAPPVPPPEAVAVDDAVANVSREVYLSMVERAKEHIRAGDAFQVVPSQRFTLQTEVDPLAVYRVLRVINPSPYMYLFEWDDLQIVGSSPEALVTVQDGQAQIWPIAGSRPRGTDPGEDAALEASLLADEKERAEHTMLVDLARNDLGRVCALGSVRVGDFMEVVRYSHVMHLLSTVSGRVREGVSAIDVLRATFPAGTLSGAPKVRAMEIIDDLEPTRRGPYGGGIGYVDLAGNLDLCITIRTLLFRDGLAHVQAGAGVVADSVPEREFDETRNKAMALLAAVRAAERLPAATAADPGAAADAVEGAGAVPARS